MSEKLREIISQSRCIVFFGGAGVSTESGIPDFRSEQGLYNAKHNYGAEPEEILSHRFFVDHPNMFYRYFKENLVFPDVRPNSAHISLAKMECMGKLKGIVTQNIDGLHQMAGSNLVYELHGSIRRYYCTECRELYSFEYIIDSANCRDPEGLEVFVPYCSRCGGIVRPDVVLYEESLDTDVMNSAIESVRCADTLIVGGTSLVVYPAAGLLRYFRGEHLILINKSPTTYDGKADLVIRESIGKVLAETVAV